jgi:hypothetical protein
MTTYAGLGLSMLRQFGKKDGRRSTVRIRMLYNDGVGKAWLRLAFHRKITLPTEDDNDDQIEGNFS